MNNFRELKVWQKAVTLSVLVYETTAQFPDLEKFNLVSQLQRSAVSIPSNIAEGAGRNSNNLFRQFLSIALGSSYELETQLLISKKLGYLNDERYNDLIEKVTELQKMIFGLSNTL
jgi:four helix bundle protein